MKFHLILTLDYELFGDGSGCLGACVVEPTDRCRAIAEAHDARLTLFVEALEFAALARLDGAPGADKYPEVEQQLSRLAASGHALQLHLHPQWLDAHHEAGNWHLDFSKWRVGSLSNSDLARCFDEGQAYLNRFAKQATVFRAGGWTIQPEGHVLEQLNERHITVDSTVAPGLYNAATGDWYDFRNAPALPYWSIQDDVCSPVSDGPVIEVPIATARIGVAAHAKALREAKQLNQFPEGCSGSYNGPNDRLQWARGRVSKVMGLGTVMLDFSTLPAWALIEATRRYMQRFANTEGPIPIVAIGHNKNFSARSQAAFTTWLEWCAQNAQIGFSDYDTWLSAATSH